MFFFSKLECADDRLPCLDLATCRFYIGSSDQDSILFCFRLGNQTRHRRRSSSLATSACHCIAVSRLPTLADCIIPARQHLQSSSVFLNMENMTPRLKRQRSPSTATRLGPATTKSKKLKLLDSHALASPFPDFSRPSAEEAHQVLNILTKAHPDITSYRRAPTASNNSAKTCSSVPNVLESLIGTILSQNTSGANSTTAKRSLDKRFGKNNFEAIATAAKGDVVEAIKMGGLANKKAGVIQTILKEVKERYGVYSLQHLAGIIEGGDSKKYNGQDDEKGKGRAVSNEDAMKELVSYDGVGPKTASCVLLFCLGRSSFPVDTHVFRLSKLLGWVPNKSDRVTAQAHLDLKIPDELKYGLHVLMVAHGRR